MKRKLCSVVLLVLTCAYVFSFGNKTLFVKRNEVVPALMRETSQSSFSEPSGWYVGTSDDLGIDSAWFLFLDFRAGCGVLYMPPANVPLNVKKSENNVSIRSAEDLGGTVYEFNGEVIPSGMSGTLRVNREKVALAAGRLIFRKVSYPQEGSNSRLTGVFSNVEYIENSGDLIGIELIVFGPANDRSAVITFFEDDMIPRMTKDVVRSAGGIKFTVRQEAGEERYSAEFVTGGLRLRRIGNKRFRFGSSVMLRKKKELASIFTESLKDKKIN